MIDLKQGYFLVVEIERKVRIGMQQLCTIIIITSLLVVIATCIITIKVKLLTLQWHRLQFYIS